MLLHIALAGLTGLLLPLQSLIAARLSAAINGPIMAALVNFAVGTLVLAALALMLRLPWPSGTQAAGVPFWAWLSGALGAFFVAQAAFTIPKLGAAGMMALVVAGQIIGSVLMDHFGVMQPVQPITPQKLLGALFLMAGVFLILRPAS